MKKVSSSKELTNVSIELIDMDNLMTLEKNVSLKSVEIKPDGTINGDVRRPEKPIYTLGDVSGDGEVTAEDARLALRAAVGLETFAAGSTQFLAADATKDGAITAEDARLILRAAVGLETLS